MTSSETVDRREALRRVGFLLGGVVSAPTVAGVLSGCQRMSGSDWSPQALTADENQMVDTISDIIIPATDTPGASAANVNRLVDAMLGDSYLPEDRDRFLTGLGAASARCEENYGAPFVDCSRDQQTELVAELDAETFGPDAADYDPQNPPFYRMMKELTIVGYYTSEIGATQELKTSIVPGRYDGDVPYEEIGRAWSGAAT